MTRSHNPSSHPTKNRSTSLGTIRPSRSERYQQMTFEQFDRLLPISRLCPPGSRRVWLGQSATWGTE